jgi:hypothetical protein
LLWALILRNFKEMKRLALYISILFTCIISGSLLYAQKSNTNKDSIVENKISNKDFVFVATWVKPMSGEMRQLTDYYDFRIHNDSITAYLPFFGRSYIAPKDPSNVSINFSSAKFAYTITRQKKGGWQINIVPDEQDDIQSFSITAFNNGVAYLSITSTNRDPISYNGYIELLK